MSEENIDIKKGLAGVVVDYTAVSKVVPETNSLTYRGYPVQELVANCTFEDVASGAANATLAAWLAERDALPGDGGFYRISQGREVGHDAIIELRVDGSGDVWSGGRARSVVTGTLDW